MRFDIPHVFIEGSGSTDGEIVSPDRINENFFYFMAGLNGGLGVENMSKSYRMPQTMARARYTPTPFRFLFHSTGVNTDEHTGRITLPAAGEMPDACLILGAEFSIYNSTGRITPVVESQNVQIGVYRTSVLVATLLWQTTYDKTVPPNTYVWPYGQTGESGAPATSRSVQLGGTEVIVVRVTASSWPAIVRATVWVLMPQYDIAPATANTQESLVREILPTEWD